MYHWASVGFCLIAFVAAGLVADLVLERVAHIEDEVAYLFQAQVFAAGHAYVDAPFQTNCFFAPFVLDYQGRRFGKYPPAWPALLSLGLRMGQAWWVNAACTALSLALVFRLGSEVQHPRVGALAAGLGCMSPFVLLMSGSLMSHPSCLLFVTAFLWCFWRARMSRRDAWALAEGVMLGAAFVIRPFTALAIALPAVLWMIWDLIQHRRATGRVGTAWRHLWFVGVGFAPLALMVPLANAVWTGDPLLSPYVLFWPYDRLGFGPGHGPLPQGNTIWLGLSSSFAALGHLANDLHGWPTLSLVFVVLLFMFKPRRKAHLFLAATAASLVFAYALYWTSGDVFGPRYAFEATSALLVLSAAGISRVWLFVQQRDSERPRRVSRRSVLAGVLVLLTLVNLAGYLPWQLKRYRGLYGVTGKARELLSEARLDNALVIVRNENGWKDYATAFAMNAPTLDGPVVYASDCEPLNELLLAHYPGRAVYEFDGREVRPYSR
jgi:4-amino-4-deoxy-L-arabinose transferase-like glycosyltransferase